MTRCPTCGTTWTSTPCSFGACGLCHEANRCEPIDRQQGAGFTAPLIYPDAANERSAS